MKSRTFFAFLSLAVFVATPAVADVLTSRIVSHDPASHTIVLSDREILRYNPQTVDMSENIQAGDMVVIEFTGAEGDMSRILSIRRAIE